MILGSNINLSTTQQSSETTLDIENVEMSISDLNQAISTLSLTQEGQEQAADYCENRSPLRQPIFRLPPEIIAAVFEHFVRDWAINYGHHGWNHYSGARHIITQVCRYWSDIAFSTPELWCDISVTHYLQVGDYYGQLLLADDIERSKDMPLHIFYGGYGDIENYPRILKLLIQTRHRWESFRTEDNFLDFFVYMRHPGSSPKFPLLKTVTGYVRLMEHILGHDYIHGPEVPSLKSVNLDLYFYDPDTPPAMPWSQLNHARLNFPNKLSCTIRTLSQLTQIKILELGIRGHVSANQTPNASRGTPLFFPFLNALTLYMDQGTPCNEIIELIPLMRAPALQVLSCVELEIPVLEATVQMLGATEFAGGVRTLELSGLDRFLDTSTFSALFRHLPHLNTLSIHKFLHPETTAGILYSLAHAPESQGGVLCPSLEQISFTATHLSAPELEHFVNSRLKYERSLEKIFLKRLVLNAGCQLSSGLIRDELEPFVEALKTFIERPGASLLVNIRAKISLNGFETPHCIYNSRHGSSEIVLEIERQER